MGLGMGCAPYVTRRRMPITSSSPVARHSSYGRVFAKRLGDSGATPTSLTCLRKFKPPPPPRYRHIRWLCVGVLAWTLWTVRNKLVIQKVPLRRATDSIFKMCGYLQLWRPLSRLRTGTPSTDSSPTSVRWPSAWRLRSRRHPRSPTRGCFPPGACAFLCVCVGLVELCPQP